MNKATSLRYRALSGMFRAIKVNKMLDKQGDEFDTLLNEYRKKQKKPLKRQRMRSLKKRPKKQRMRKQKKHRTVRWRSLRRRPKRSLREAVSKSVTGS